MLYANAQAQLNLDIPPSAPAFAAPPGICPQECTNRFPWPLTLTENDFHMHKTGTSMTTQLFRGGAQLQPLGVRRFYDSDYQVSIVP